MYLIKINIIISDNWAQEGNIRGSAAAVKDIAAQFDPIISIACGLRLRDFSYIKYIISIKDHMHIIINTKIK